MLIHVYMDRLLFTTSLHPEQLACSAPSMFGGSAAVRTYLGVSCEQGNMLYRGYTGIIQGLYRDYVPIVPTKNQ